MTSSCVLESREGNDGRVPDVLEREDCAVGEVQCEDEVTCIPENFQCDRFLDCPDRSDEPLECGTL